MAATKNIRITDTNLFCLAELFGSEKSVPNGGIRATDRRHIKRCQQAGLFVIEGSNLVLTDAGVAALAAR